MLYALYLYDRFLFSRRGCLEVNTHVSTRRLSLPTMLAFGVGQAVEGFQAHAFNLFLLFYYQQIVGMSGTLAGLALGIGLVFDAISDPAAGVLSDRFSSRWGRRHPFIFVSAFPLFITFIAVFNPPAHLGEFGNFLWLTVFAVLVRASLTFHYVPHLALGADMAHDYDQRSTLFALSTVFAITAMAVVGLVGYGLFFPTSEAFSPGTLNPEAYFGFSVAIAVAMFVVTMICCFGTAKEIPHLHNTTTSEALTSRWVLRVYKQVFANKSFRMIFAGMVLSTFAVAVEAILSPFMGVHFWGLRTEQLALIPLATIAGLWLGLPITTLLTRLLDKRFALVLPAIFIAVNNNAALGLRLMDVSWFPDNESPWIFWILVARYLLQGMALPVVLASFNSMFADIADEVELDNDARREGVIFSARSFANKIAAALGAVLGGVVIDLIRFPTNATAGTVHADVVWWLGLTEGPVLSCVSAIGVLFYLRYEITRERHAEIVEKISLRKNGELSGR